MTPQYSLQNVGISIAIPLTIVYNWNRDDKKHIGRARRVRTSPRPYAGETLTPVPHSRNVLRPKPILSAFPEFYKRESVGVCVASKRCRDLLPCAAFCCLNGKANGGREREYHPWWPVPLRLEGRKPKVKRITALVTALSMVLFLAACGGKDADQPSNNKPPVTQGEQNQQQTVLSSISQVMQIWCEISAEK